jgi:uncharacterized protein
MIPRIALALILIAIDVYAFQGIQTALGSYPFFIIFKAIYWGFTAAVIGGILASLVIDRHRWPKALMLYFPPVFLGAFLGKFILILFLLLDDLIRIGQVIGGQESAERIAALSWIGLIAGGIPFLLLMYGMIRNAYRYEVREIPLALKALHPDLKGLKIVQISDIHSGSLNRPDLVSQAVDRINALHPDIIFFTGDLVNLVASEAEPYLSVFSRLKAPHGVFSITGNHDYGDYVAWQNQEQKVENFRQLMEMHQRLGWRLLMNEHELIRIGKATLAIIGIENWSAFGRFPKYGDLPKAHQGTSTADVRLLLSHDPSHWKAQVLTDFPDIDAMFAGHTHGFQFGLEIGNWKWSPGQYFYKEWAGLYEQAKRYLYVNRGFGYTFYPGRVGMRPEITLFELV